MQRVAASWLIYTLSGSGVWLGIDSLAAGLPTILLLPIGGIAADRYNRQTILIVANVAQAFLALTVAWLWWYGWLSVVALIVCSLLAGIITSISAPANQAIVPAAAGEDHLKNAIALNSLQYNVARVLGPAIGGLAIASMGAGGCFALNAFSFLVMAGTLLSIRNIPQSKRNQPLGYRDLSEVKQFVWTTPAMKRSLFLIVLLAFTSAPIITLLPIIADQIHKSNASGYSALLSCFGVGGALAGLAVAAFPASKKTQAWSSIALPLLGATLVLLPLVRYQVMSFLLVSLAGACMIGSMIQLGTTLLKDTPDDLRGRVSGLQQLGFRVAQPLGGFVAAMLIHWFGVSLVFASFGILLALTSSTILRTHKLPAMESTPDF